METIMNEQRFSTGDRVRTMRAVGTFPAGTRGTVAYTFLLAPIYQVCFDGETIPQLVMHEKLAPDLPESTSGTDPS